MLLLLLAPLSSLLGVFHRNEMEMWHSLVGFLPGPVPTSGGVCDIFPATPSCSQNSCWGLLWQLSTESTEIHLPSMTLLFQFSHSHFFSHLPPPSFFFCMAVIQVAYIGGFLFGGRWCEKLECITLFFFFWIAFGRYNYSILWRKQSCWTFKLYRRHIQERQPLILHPFHVTFDIYLQSQRRLRMIPHQIDT